MKGNFLEKLRDMWDKFKKNKKIQIGLLIVFLLVIILVYFLAIKIPDNEETTANESQETTSTSSYVEYLEDKLVNVLSSIEGVGKLDVIITLDSGFEYIYATEESVKDTSSGKLTTSNIVLVSGQPIIVKEIYPIIKGVVVVSSGAKDLGVKLNLLNAVQTVLEVPNANITILS